MVVFGIIVLSLFVYWIVGMFGSLVTGRVEASDGVLWAPRLANHYVVKPLKLAHERKNHIPTANEVVCGVIAVAVVKHFDNWQMKNDRSLIHSWHEFRHKQIVAKRQKDYSFSEESFTVKFGDVEIQITDELKKALSKSFAMKQDSAKNKEHYRKEQKLLTTLEEYLK